MQVVPSDHMQIKAGRCVSSAGRVTVPYLMDWGKKDEVSCYDQELRFNSEQELIARVGHAGLLSSPLNRDPRLAIRPRIPSRVHRANAAVSSKSLFQPAYLGLQV